jgi:hypothetical protein
MVLLQNSEPNDIEEQFLKTFVLPNFYDRARYEIFSKNTKKREKFFSRLSQTSTSILKKDCIVEIPHLVAELEFSTIRSMLISYGATDISYIMSNIRGMIQEILPLNEGLERCLNHSMAVVLICTENLALVQLERLSGSPYRFLLTRKTVY